MPLVKKTIAAAATGAAVPDAAAAALSLQHADAAVRWNAVRALAGQQTAVPLLAAALHNETEPALREAIFSALARIGTPESFAAVLLHLRGDDAAARTAALDALKLMPGPAAARLDELLHDHDPDIRLLVCELARVVASGEAALTGLLRRETVVNVCAAAIEILAEIGGAASLPALQDCAARFPNESFLAFSIRLAAGQIAARGTFFET